MNNYKYSDKNDLMTTIFVKDEELTSEYWNSSEKNALNIVFKYIDEEKCNMLDLGCGIGRLFSFFINHVKSIVGVEVDYSRFKKAQEESKRINSNSITVLNTDINGLNNKYDLILISHIIQHIPLKEVENIISNLRRLLNENGVICLTTTYSNDKDELFLKKLLDDGTVENEYITEEELDNYKHEFYVRKYTSKTINELFNKYGFNIIEKYAYHFRKNNLEPSVINDFNNNKNNNLKDCIDILYIIKKSN